VRCKTGGGHAGHNGLRSIHAHIGEGYDRVRMGIGHPGRKELVSGYVLHDFAKADGEWLDDVLRGVSDGAEALAAGDSARFLNAVALRVAPARSGTGQGAASGGKKAKPVDRPAGEGRAPERADAAGAAHVQQAPETLPVETPDSRGLLQRLADRFK
jgi:PTH1 family peptidyl-tRNA hydrolase